MITKPPATYLPYEYLYKNYRLLWHQSLNTILRYPRLPRKTINFDCYPVNKLRHNHQRTLGGSVTTSHGRYIGDCEIVETWLADDVSMTTGFFYELLRLYNAAIESGEHLIWYPKDKTDKCFSIQPLDIEAGGSDDMDVNPINRCLYWDYRFLRSEIKFKFAVRRIYDIPSAVVTVEGT